MPEVSHYNILLAEDEPILLNSLKNTIHQLDMGFVVTHTAQNGQEALALLKDNDIHLVISDIVMPGMSGLDLLSVIKHFRANMPVVMLSGYAEFEYVQQALRAGAMDYLLKPATTGKIEGVLMLAKSQLENYYKLIQDESLSGQSATQALAYATDYLKKHYTEDVEINALAQALGFSSAYLTKLFKNHENTTPVRYLTRLRIEEAKNLLYNTELPIKEVGERVGYENQFYFSRLFHKEVQMTPSAYRERRKQDRRQ